MAVEQEVLDRYALANQTIATIFDHPSHEWPDRLGAVLTEPSLSTGLANLARMETAGEEFYGRIGARDPQATVDGDTATVTDCEDQSNYGRRRADTGRVLSVGNERQPIEATLLLGSDGEWRVSNVAFPEGTC